MLLSYCDESFPSHSHPPSTKNAKWVGKQQHWMQGPHDLTECWVLAKCLNLLDNHQVVKVKKHHVAKLIHERKHYFCIKYRELSETVNTISYTELYRISGTCQYKICSIFINMYIYKYV